MISQGETMEKVRVKPQKLIAKLKENFERHKKELEVANKNYLAAAIKSLGIRLTSLKDGKVVDLRFNLDPPDDHTEDYERAITMLEMSEDETVTITSTQFAAFVQDQWQWKQNFLLKNSTYMV